MTTIAILPVATSSGGMEYQAVSGRRFAVGRSAGQALDALAAQFPELGSEGLVIVQRFRPDRFFTAEQQRRLQDLMWCWREARARGEAFAEAEREELESLIAAELKASAQRAAVIAQTLP